MFTQFTDNRWNCEVYEMVQDKISVPKPRIPTSTFRPERRVSFVTSQRGKEKAVLDGHQYYLVRSRKDPDYRCWNCEKFYTGFNCKARVCLY